MPNRRAIAISIALSALLHVVGFFAAFVVPSKGTPREEVMVVDLADLPRSPDFLPAKPGIIEGGRPRPVPPPRIMKESPMAGKVPDRPVDARLAPEKAFPPERARAERPPGEKPPEEKASGGPAAGEKPPAESSQPPAPAGKSPPEKTPGPPAASGSLKPLKDLTPSLGKMVLARREDGGGRGDAASKGTAVGTGGTAREKGEIAEERGGGTHLTALNAPEIQYISYFASIKRKIELVWQYPDAALRSGLQGDLVIDFTIGRGGTLDGLTLVRGSGHRILDEEAITSIRKAAPYNPIPAQYRIPNLQIRAHFVYEMHNIRIR